MQKIVFYYRNGSSLITFAAILEVLFRLWHLDSALIKYVYAGNDKTAGEFVLKDYELSPSPILIVEDSITIQGDTLHITLSKDDTFSSLMKKMNEAGIE